MAATSLSPIVLLKVQTVALRLVAGRPVAVRRPLAFQVEKMSVAVSPGSTRLVSVVAVCGGEGWGFVGEEARSGPPSGGEERGDGLV